MPEKAATLRKQKEKEWAIKAKQIEAKVEIEKQRKAAEHAKAMREQKAKENGNDISKVIAGIDPVLHNNMVADLRQEISSLKEQLTLNSNVISKGINDLGSNNHVISKRAVEQGIDLVISEDEAVKKLDEVISTYSDSDSGYDESLEDSRIASSVSSSDTNSVVSAAALQSKPNVSEIVQEELLDIEQELQSQKLKEEESVEAVEDILGKDLMTDTGDSQADANSSTADHQKVLTEKARFIARAKEDLRFGSKAVSKQIRHRLSARDIGNMVAISAGDEEQDIAPSYSIWSSGIFGGSKQKAISAALGYSSRIHGGSIGGEINLSSGVCHIFCVSC